MPRLKTKRHSSDEEGVGVDGRGVSSIFRRKFKGKLSLKAMNLISWYLGRDPDQLTLISVEDAVKKLRESIPEERELILYQAKTPEEVLRLLDLERYELSSDIQAKIFANQFVLPQNFNVSVDYKLYIKPTLLELFHRQNRNFLFERMTEGEFALVIKGLSNILTEAIPDRERHVNLMMEEDFIEKAQKSNQARHGIPLLAMIDDLVRDTTPPPTPRTPPPEYPREPQPEHKRLRNPEEGDGGRPFKILWVNRYNKVFDDNVTEEDFKQRILIDVERFLRQIPEAPTLEAFLDDKTYTNMAYYKRYREDDDIHITPKVFRLRETLRPYLVNKLRGKSADGEAFLTSLEDDKIFVDKIAPRLGTIIGRPHVTPTEAREFVQQLPIESFRPQLWGIERIYAPTTPDTQQHPTQPTMFPRAPPTHSMHNPSQQDTASDVYHSPPPSPSHIPSPSPRAGGESHMPYRHLGYNIFNQKHDITKVKSGWSGESGGGFSFIINKKNKYGYLPQKTYPLGYN